MMHVHVLLELCGISYTAIVELGGKDAPIAVKAEQLAPLKSGEVRHIADKRSLFCGTINYRKARANLEAVTPVKRDDIFERSAARTEIVYDRHRLPYPPKAVNLILKAVGFRVEPRTDHGDVDHVRKHDCKRRDGLGRIADAVKRDAALPDKRFHIPRHSFPK